MHWIIQHVLPSVKNLKEICESIFTAINIRISYLFPLLVVSYSIYLSKMLKAGRQSFKEIRVWKVIHTPRFRDMFNKFHCICKLYNYRLKATLGQSITLFFFAFQIIMNERKFTTSTAVNLSIVWQVWNFSRLVATAVRASVVVTVPNHLDAFPILHTLYSGGNTVCKNKLLSDTCLALKYLNLLHNSNKCVRVYAM